MDQVSRADGRDMVNHPPHYTSGDAKCSACGKAIECIDVTQHMPFTIGNAVKYLWRQGLKGSAVEDLKKAAWYIAREIERRSRAARDEIVPPPPPTALRIEVPYPPGVTLALEPEPMKAAPTPPLAVPGNGDRQAALVSHVEAMIHEKQTDGRESYLGGLR